MRIIYRGRMKGIRGGVELLTDGENRMLSRSDEELLGQLKMLAWLGHTLPKEIRGHKAFQEAAEKAESAILEALAEHFRQDHAIN